MFGLDKITSVPTVLSRQTTIRGTRLTVRRLIEALAVWQNWDDLCREYLELEPDDIRKAIAYAARILDESAQNIESV